jgi:sucrose-6-phosphate hydrolase SacC (GH32 family)
VNGASGTPDFAEMIRAARALRKLHADDPHRPRFHLVPPEGWSWDVNGTVFHRGRYHVFYIQRLYDDPDAPAHGDAHGWGHSSSADLVHWVHHPHAVLPETGPSAPPRIFSGDAVEGSDPPVLMYHVPGKGICLSFPRDEELVSWEPYCGNPVIPEGGGDEEFIVFDPCAWKDGEVYYALIGNRNRRPGFEGDSTSLFTSPDLISWRYLGPFYRSDRRFTEEFEDCACPDFFPLGDRHVLLSHRHRPYTHCAYYIGEYRSGNARDKVSSIGGDDERVFIPEKFGRMSWINDQLCAPETLSDDRGRRIFFGQIRASNLDWTTCCSLPRVLGLDPDGELTVEPAPELETLRYDEKIFESITVEDEVLPLAEIGSGCMELRVTVIPGNAREFGVEVRRSPDGEETVPIRIDREGSRLNVDLSFSSRDPRRAYYRYSPRMIKEGYLERNEEVDRQSAPFHFVPNCPIELRIFVDRSVIEVFANGRLCVTQTVYPTRLDAVGAAVFATGGRATFLNLTAWRIHPVC